MAYSLELQQKSKQSLKQMQRLIMSRQMQQAIHLLQMPVMELSLAVEAELEQNPVLECSEDEGQEDAERRLLNLEDNTREDTIHDTKAESELQFDTHDFETLLKLDEDFRSTFSENGGANGKRTQDQEKLQTFLEASIIQEETLFGHLMKQAEEVFDSKQEMALAEALIGNFNENGFLTTPIEEVAILQPCPVEKLEEMLKIIQTFHPAGVGARNLKESLLIQLQLQGKQSKLAYRIIETHFDDLIHNRIPNIKKGLKCTSEAIAEMVDCHIVKLDLHPGMCFSRQVNMAIVPDATIIQEDENLLVVVNEDSVVPLRLNKRYLRLLTDHTVSKEDKEFIQQKILSAKWLMRNIFQRNETIEKIAKELVKRQKAFFSDPQGKLVPLTMRVIAEELQLHESTIARAVSNKSIATPRGLLPLRFFFTSSIETDKGEDLSSRSVKDLILTLISQENKSRPLSDDAIAVMIQAKGIHCARRTVAKYRTALNIGSSQQRRKF